MTVEMLNSGNVNSEPTNIIISKYEKYAFIIVVIVLFFFIGLLFYANRCSDTKTDKRNPKLIIYP